MVVLQAPTLASVHSLWSALRFLRFLSGLWFSLFLTLFFLPFNILWICFSTALWEQSDRVLGPHLERRLLLIVLRIKPFHFIQIHSPRFICFFHLIRRSFLHHLFSLPILITTEIISFLVTKSDSEIWFHKLWEYSSRGTLSWNNNRYLLLTLFSKSILFVFLMCFLNLNSS